MERGLLNSKGRRLIHEGLILEVLEALKKLEDIAIVHVKGHQRGMTFEMKGNNLADREAKEAAEKGSARAVTIMLEREERVEIPVFGEAEERELIRIGGKKDENGRWELMDGRQLLNKFLTRRILENIHWKTHWGTQALCDLFLRFCGRVGVYGLAKKVTEGCMICQKAN